MAQEINYGAAYLTALRQSANGAGTGVGAAVTPASKTNPVESNSAGAGQAGAGVGEIGGSALPSGAEKRRSPRYKYEGSVEMREEGCDVRTWATFTDISMHGCYAEVTATYPVGTVLHLKLAANGFEVQTVSCVRVSYPYLGMGIAFTEMTEGNRTSLREMLQTISRPSVIMGPGIASTLPGKGPLKAVPMISDPGAANPGAGGVFRKPANADAGRISPPAAQEPGTGHDEPVAPS
jgi:hypothetical protein